jgi:hypothetical protein
MARPGQTRSMLSNVHSDLPHDMTKVWDKIAQNRFVVLKIKANQGKSSPARGNFSLKYVEIRNAACQKSL